ncbi:MAG: hypothetical protein DRQ39_07210 [Gammaproteobacteria bacterium]|nr:MAG: hypothetical protein DRQ39_07210 [Gammaproteobacteria bacterium]
MRIDNLRKHQITESYIKGIGSNTANQELTEVFARFNKLSGNTQHDTAIIQKWTGLMEAEGEDFDVFGHMQTDNLIDAGEDSIDTDTDCVLTIDPPNKKLEIAVNAQSLSLPAGYTCPFANVCKSMASRHGKPFKDGKKIKDMGDVRCYAAGEEARFKNVRAKRWTNYDLLRGLGDDVKAITDLILRSIKFYEQEREKINTLRIHESGDFYSQAYFDGWLEAAKQRPQILFYAYTKSIEYVGNRSDDMPKNFRITGSVGGMQDDMIKLFGLRSATIVNDPEEAAAKRLPVDVNDTMAAYGDQDFGLLLHGTQSKESGNTSQAQKNSKLVKGVNKSRKVDFDWMNTQRKKYVD